METIYKSLTLKRASIKGRVTKFSNQLDEFEGKKPTPIELNVLSQKLVKIEALFVEFDSVQSSIEELDDIKLSSELDTREAIEQSFHNSIAKAQEIISTNNSRKKSTFEHSSSFAADDDDHEVIGFRLPVIKINNFDGTFFKWLEFHDTFSSLIHNNPKIKNIHKFHYLNSYLEGEAARVISNLEVTDNNYIEAWHILCERYNNVRQLVNNHLKSLFSIEPLRESDKSLRFLIDHITKNLRALHSLKQPTDHWDTVIIYTFAAKLDSNTRVKWEEYIHANVDALEMPTLDDFMSFIRGRADVLESVYRSKQDKVTKSLPNQFQSTKQTLNSHTKSFVTSNQDYSSARNFKKCLFCNSDTHRIYDCPQFKSTSIDDKFAFVSKLQLCKNCLRQGHQQRACRLPGTCKICRKRHNTNLHKSLEPDTVNTESEPVSMSAVSSSETLLCTALVEITNPITNKSLKTKALLDSGSQSSFVTEALKEQLNLIPLNSSTKNVIGIGNTTYKLTAEHCNIRISSIVRSFSTMTSCLVIPQITGKIPKANLNITHLNLKSFELADPSFHEPSEIGLLIGADLFWEIIGTQQHSLGKGNPILHDSKLGWLIAGPMSNAWNVHNIKCNLASIEYNNSTIELHNDLKLFWELESLPQKPLLSDEQRACELHFLQNTKRTEDGRFCVKLPLTDDIDCLGESYFTAKHRFLNLERRFRKHPELKSAYVNFINEYHSLGHLSPAQEDRPASSYFVPHHPVIREDSESTRLRVVFDASARTTSGLSINDIQMIGPSVQDSLFNILIRFRQHRYVLSGDIEKMYRQVLVDDSDRNMQLILWRDAEDKTLQTLQLNTVTYGFASASYLATKCLWQVGEECDDLIKTIIQQDIYVDDLLTSNDDESQLRCIQQSLSANLIQAGFNLRKYRSNLPCLLPPDISQSSDSLTFSHSTNTLGLDWNPSSDSLHFPIGVDHTSVVTKRSILSSTFKIFDPLGLLSLCTIVPKILIQTLWSLKFDWDDPAPKEVVKVWKTFIEGLKFISNLYVPRWVSVQDPISVEIHCFCDASQRAYGACLYIRSIDREGRVQVHLLCAKSRVAPMSNTITIPRLELLGALLAAEMSSSVTQALRRKVTRQVYWTDSSIVLSWLRIDSVNLKTFVANRVASIRELTDIDSWKHVPTEHNPADLVSRGINPQEVPNCDMWWHGPSFLLLPESNWFNSQPKNNDDLPEVKVLACTKDNTDELFHLKKFSNFSQLKHIFAYIHRFIHNCKNPTNKYTGPLNIYELNKAYNSLILISQLESFPKEYDILAKGNSLKSKSHICALNPFLHEGLIRVGGRIQASEYSFDMKHPMLLSAKHHFTNLLFQHEHRQLLHAGPQALLASIRTRVWPIGGRNLARRIVRNCNICRRFQGKTMQNIMGNLPTDRLVPDFPFLTVGTDFAGPFMITDRKGRGCKITKSYLCVFICFRYKCVHLEAVSELSKDAFILSLKRFIARRGLPNKIYCDNGGNFVAASKEIREFFNANQDSILELAASEGVKFRFSPAYAPHFNGLMEACVKSAKFHLLRILGTAHLTFEELSSLFAQIESILNSRPLCPLSSSPSDLYPLTPGHFLIGRPLQALPSPCLQAANANRLDRFRRLEQVRQHFWKRWSHEYIAELQMRAKWRVKSGEALEIGDLVILKEDNTPPLYWRLGRIEGLFPGSDGVTRVADIYTARGTVRRALNRICLLPKPNEENKA